jgi:hypothetical protein
VTGAIALTASWFRDLALVRFYGSRIQMVLYLILSLFDDVLVFMFN